MLKKYLITSLFILFTLNLSTPAECSVADVLKNTSEWKDETGQTVTFSDWKGKSLVLTLFYTQCKKTCPNLTLVKLSAIQKKLDETKQTAEFIIATLDPENDTSHDLLNFKKNRGFDRKNWHFIRGSVADTRRFATQIGLGGYWEMDDHIQHGFRIVYYDEKNKTESFLDHENRDPNRLFTNPTPSKKE